MQKKIEQILSVSGTLISLAKAATLTPYSAEYLGLLVRKHRLPAVKLSRDWLTTREAVLTYVNEQKRKHQNELRRFEAQKERQ